MSRLNGFTKEEAERTVAAMAQAIEEGHPRFGNRGKAGARIRAAEILGISVATVKSRMEANGPCAKWGVFLPGEKPDNPALDFEIRRRAEKGELGTLPVLPGYVLKKTSAQLDGEGNLEREWVQQTKEPGEQFEVPAGHVVKGVSALVDAEGRVLAKWTKTREDRPSELLLEAIKETFACYDGLAQLVPPPAFADASLLSVYPIADQHNGLLSWGRETGESYDLKIGAARLRSCMARLVSQSPPAAHALILNLGDWTHQDDSRNMTPRGNNILDVDGRYAKVLSTGVRLMMDCIDLALAKHEHVLVRNLPGNHDPHASFTLTIALSCFYAGNPRVTIDDSPSEWFFHRFGETLIGAHHGHKAKPDQMAMMMAVERREDWGATRYHWIMAGHIHHESAKEVGDVRCETFQTLASRDAYSAGAGYSSGRSLTSVTVHETEGEIGRHRINVPPPPPRGPSARSFTG